MTNVTIQLLHRIGQVQVEKVTFAPFTKVPVHSHPHVNSREHYLRGSIDFEINGHHFLVTPKLPPHRRTFTIPAGVEHGGVAGPDGVEFISVQEWQDGIKPTTIGDDWQGPFIPWHNI